MSATRLYWAIFLLVWSNLDSFGQEHSALTQLKIATFDVDATPPIGDPLTYDSTANSWDLGLRAKGIVLQGAGQPIVLVAVDWIGIANDSQDAFKEALAEAANTVPERVAVHALHQHDAPISDFGAEKILLEAGLDPAAFESSFDKEVIRRLQAAIRVSLPQAQPVTHIGTGEAATDWNLIMATTMLALIPPVLIVILMQRWFVKGLVDSDK